MKLIILTRYFLPVKGGIENHCYNLAKELLKRGIDVEIHTSRDTLTETNILKEFEIIDGIKVYRHKNFWRFIPKDCDVIHLHNFNIFPHFWIFLKIFIKRLFKMKAPRLIITPHGGFTPWWKEFSISAKIIKKIYHKALGKFFLNHVVDKIIAVSEWEKNQLVKEDINAKKIVVIPNGVEEEAYTIPKKEDSNLGRYKPYILFIGRISRLKNLDFIIKSLKKINDINFIIAGPVHEESYYIYLKDIIAQMNLQNRVFFSGVVKGEPKYSLIDNALAVVLLSHNESEPIVIKEAMVRGKPVIVSNKSALPYIVKDNENGFVVSTEKEFIDSIKKLMTNKELINKIEKNNREFGKKWRWTIIANEILKVYKGVMK